MSKLTKVTLGNVLDLLDENKYPIIHYSAELSVCSFCCPINSELLSQCSHYLVVLNYDETIKCIEVKLITHSSGFGNISPKSNQFSTFKNIEVDYYTKDTFILSYECLEETYLFGYFNYI